MLKRPSFETFTDVSNVEFIASAFALTFLLQSVKYQTSGIGNIGVRELLAEPVQRIPRYTLLWQGACCRYTTSPIAITDNLANRDG